MGLFDSLFGDTKYTDNKTQASGTQVANGTTSGTSNTNTTQNTNQTNNTTQQSQTSQQSQQQSATNTNNVISSLDDNTKALLTSLAPLLAANANNAASNGSSNVSALQNIASALYDKSSGADTQGVTDAINAGTASAKLAYQTGEGQAVAQTQQQIGSKSNTFSQLLNNKGQNDLATQIGNVIAQAKLQGNAQSSSDLTAAASVLGTSSGVNATDQNASVTPLLNLVSALKGATTTSSGTEASTAASSASQNTTAQTLATLLSSILGTSNETANTANSTTTVSDETQTTKGKGVDSPGVLTALFG